MVGQRVSEVPWPADVALAAIIRGERPIAPSPDDTLENGDELLLLVTSAQPETLAALQELLGAAPATT